MEALVKITFSDGDPEEYFYRLTKGKYCGGNRDFYKLDKYEWPMDEDDKDVIKEVTYVMPICLLENEE